jgi:hypothetical protein
MGGELVGNVGPVGEWCKKVATRDVNLIRKADRDRFSCRGCGLVAIRTKDAGNTALLARCRHHHAVTNRDLPRCHSAGETTEVEVGTIHPLYGEAKRLTRRVLIYVHALKVVHQRRAAVPGSIAAALGDIVAKTRRNRNGH